MLAIPPPLWQPIPMADRIEPIRKTPAEILSDLLDGHEEALRIGGHEKGRKYLQNFIERANSVPNAVKFFLFDLLAEDTFRAGDAEACRAAVARAADYLPAAQEEMAVVSDMDASMLTPNSPRDSSERKATSRQSRWK